MPLPDGMIAVDYAPFSELFPRAVSPAHKARVSRRRRRRVPEGQRSCIKAGWEQRHKRYERVCPCWSYHTRLISPMPLRVVRLGVAQQIPRESYHRKQAVTALRQLLTNPTSKKIAQSVKERVDASDGVQSACDAIERTFFKLNC